jgi:hypothetical protein
MKYKDYEKPAIHIVEVRPQLLISDSSDQKSKRKGYRNAYEDEDEDEVVWE